MKVKKRFAEHCGHGLRWLLSATLVMGLIPTPALAEALDGEDIQDDVAVEQVLEATDEVGYVEDEGTVLPATEEDETLVVDDEVDAQVAEDEDQVASVVSEETKAGSPEIVLTAQADVIVEIELDKDLDIELDEGERWVGHFTAPSDGFYTFFTLGDDDTAGYLYSSLDELDSEEYLAYDDDGGENTNFLLNKRLTKGEEVYVLAQQLGGGSASFSFHAAKGMSVGNMNWSYDRFVFYDGSKKTPIIQSVSFTDEYGNEVFLTEGTDFQIQNVMTEAGDLLEDIPTECGYYYATYQGIGEYVGTYTIYYSIHQSNDLWGAHIELPESLYVYTGQPIELDATVIDVAGNVLVEGRDFEFVFYDEDWNETTPIEPGSYTIRAVAVEGGAYENMTNEWNFSIVKITELSLANTVHVSSSGEEIACFFRAPEAGMYTISSPYDEAVYANFYSSIDRSEASAQGLYWSSDDTTDQFFSCRLEAGETVYMFLGTWSDVIDIDISVAPGIPIQMCAADYTSDYYEDEHITYPDNVELYRIDSEGDTSYLIEGEDYRISEFTDATGHPLPTAPSTSGKYQLIIEGLGDYTGTKALPFVIHGDNELSTMEAYLYSDAYPETGNPVEVDYRIYNKNGNLLKQGIDYVLKYRDANGEELPGAPTGLGSYDVWAEALSDSGYVGSTWPQVFYIVDGRDLASAQIEERAYRYEYTGNPVALDVVVRDPKANVLTEGVDFEFKYYDYSGPTPRLIDGAPTEAGSYAFVAAALPSGNYTGQSSYHSFSIIDSYNIENAYIGLSGWVSSYYDGQYISTFLYENQPVKPSVSLSTDDAMLVEGTDYILRYENNDGATTLDSPAKVIIEGKGKYHGSTTRSFMIVDSMSLDTVFHDTSIRLLFGNQYTYYSEWYGTPQYLYSGGAITPSIAYETGYDRRMPQPGVDYAVSYVDESGLTVVPKEVGSYKIVLTAVESSPFTGTYEIPFDIVATRDILNAQLELNDVSYSTSGYSGGLRTFNVYELFEKVGNLAWSIRCNGIALVENLDYVVTKTINSAINRIAYVFTGKGAYTGTVTAVVYASNAQTVLDNRYFVSRYVYYPKMIVMSSDGKLSKPMVSISGLVNGVDYEVAGILDSNGNSIQTAEEGDSVYIQIKGLNDYAGSERLVEASVVAGSPARSFDDADVYAILANGVNVYKDGKNTLYLKKSVAPIVQVKVYNPTLELEQGNGFSVATATSADGKTMNITVTAEKNQIISGSTTITATLVDSYNLKDVATSVYVRGCDSWSGGYYGTDGNPVAIAYYGFGFTPTAYANSRPGQQPTCKTTLRDAKGAVVSSGKITGVGNYTIDLTGTGDFTGTVSVPITVYAATTRLHVDECELSLGSTALANGKAEPAVTLKCGDTTFKQGTDYTVEYGANTEVGSNAYVKVTAVEGGKLVGTRAMNFVVTDGTQSKDLTNGYELLLQSPTTSTHFQSIKYGPLRAYKMGSNGSATPAVLVVGASQPLGSENYTVTYKDNTAEGMASVTVTGKNGYTGSLSANFIVLPADETSFRDVTEKTPHADDITWLADAGISTGWKKSDGTVEFRPTNTVIRQDMAAFLFRLAKLWGLVDDSWQPTGKVTFTDVSAKTPHYREIMWLAESGISAGWKVGNGREFRPTNTVVRQDMAAFLRRLQALRDPSVRDWQPTGASPFRDVTSKTPHYDDILWLAESGVSAGWKVSGGKEFRPMNTVIRQDMAAFLHRLDNLG